MDDVVNISLQAVKHMTRDKDQGPQKRPEKKTKAAASEKGAKRDKKDESNDSEQDHRSERSNSQMRDDARSQSDKARTHTS